MAKKKTAEKAKIEAPPVLRVEPAPDPEETSITKSYIMRDDWIDKGVVNTVAFKSVDGEVQDVLVNGEPAGGGGSMRTCTVHMKNNTGNDIMVAIPYLNGFEVCSIFDLDGHIDQDIEVILPTAEGYGSYAMLTVDSGWTITGNIMKTGITLTITGDGSIIYG